ncbi:Crp/Fnr family transcriptional regulator [Methylobacterium sp. C25]|uniref:Crp/Fnr family transcriptional regulator n=1 Tax=Methylobacterium sp. C25 TaxID=2721622 RepID=UPI001F291DE4|nr:Crp/Fnr family transcriptional regulator [Methylobacterium sp. C25]MCE4226980.1 Crp/Fnr family transcriptional regulator [Methylobacterium sp. C25]
MLTRSGAGDCGFLLTPAPEQDGSVYQPIQNACENGLLRALAEGDFGLLQPHMQSVLLSVGNVLIAAGTPITQVYFVEQGIVSCIVQASDDERIEIGLVGREGLVGTPILLDADRASNEARVQAAGWAWSLRADTLRDAMRQSARLQSTLLRYVQTFSTQVACTALANGRYKLDQRLARWLLMCHDRVMGDELPTTHRFLSVMLGVNRPGLTSAIANLERAGIIASKRGSITIRDHGALLAMAGGSYGPPEAEYQSLITGLASHE